MTIPPPTWGRALLSRVRAAERGRARRIRGESRGASSSASSREIDCCCFVVRQCRSTLETRRKTQTEGTSSAGGLSRRFARRVCVCPLHVWRVACARNCSQCRGQSTATTTRDLRRASGADSAVSDFPKIHASDPSVSWSTLCSRTHAVALQNTVRHRPRRPTHRRPARCHADSPTRHDGDVRLRGPRPHRSPLLRLSPPPPHGGQPQPSPRSNDAADDDGNPRTSFWVPHQPQQRSKRRRLLSAPAPRSPQAGGYENKHFTDAAYPAPPPRVCLCSLLP